MKRTFIISGIILALFILWTVIIGSVDVSPVGPLGSSVGLATLNRQFHNMTGVHLELYNITDQLSIIPLAIVCYFAVTGLLQWIHRKKLLLVDHDILALGGFYTVVMALFIFFEICVINYRPIIMPGEELPEAAFPSSHTMLTCVIMGSALPMIRAYIKNTKLQLVLEIVCVLIIVTMVAGRLMSGVHWLTDIFGAVLLSVTLLGIFDGVKELVNKK